MGYLVFTCKKGHNTIHDETYDAYFCSICEEWVEKKCSDTACEFCTTRPDKPPKVIMQEEET